jgi:hypothetical protein
MRWWVIVEKLVEWKLAGEIEVVYSEKNLPQRHFVHHISHMTRPSFEPGRRGGKPATIFLLLLFGVWVYWHCGRAWAIMPASGDSEDDCGEADGM